MPDTAQTRVLDLSQNGGPAPIVEMSGLKISYRTGEMSFTVLDIDELALPAGLSIGLSGPSGCGKSTLLNLCAGLLRPTVGSIRVDGEELTGLGQGALDRFRAKKIGYVFQGFNLIPALSALGNVELPMRLSGSMPASLRRARAQELLDRVELGTKARQKPNQLSFGQMQRVGIARAIAGHPRLLLADEPTASLEPGLGLSIVRLLIAVAKENSATLVVATHDPAVLTELDHTLTMSAINRAMEVSS
ncbi:ABC transporter ATP-binding protein [Filomicrobium sp.]|uniref:ABC transporter ATP-binding protein n=1 Tax=Filomicrobium sp. TaxID=2024831 RepID=UPI0025843F4E|nr:ABC transporter ATP-binding protein [Filomicrobium sp.]